MQTEPPAFAEHMIDAVTQAQAGFHFEEGGCWGMALALRDAFASMGGIPRLAVSCWEGRTSHAMVEVDGVFYDHQGVVLRRPDSLMLVEESAFVEAYELAGWSDCEVAEDKEWADAIVELAREMAGEIVPKP